MTFQSSISQRFNQLNDEQVLPDKKIQLQQRFGILLRDGDGNKINRLTDFHIGFLDLLHEKYSSLSLAFQDELHQAFSDMYKESGEAEEPKLEPSSELQLNSIQLPTVNSDEWQIAYEMMSDDTIFHVEFEGWNFTMIGITH